MCLCGLTFPQGRLHREKKAKRNKENVLSHNSLGSASRRASTERRKTKKTFFCFYADWPSPRVDYTEGRKTKKNFFVFLAQKKFFLVFLLSVEVLLEADHNDFWLKTFSFFSLSLSFLCVFYPRGRSDCIKSQNKFFLRQILLNFDLGHFMFCSLSLFSLCVSFLPIFVDMWSCWSEEHICLYNALYINRFLLTFRADDL